MQISETCPIIPWSHVEEFSTRRIVKVPTSGGSWSQGVSGLHLLVHIEAAAIVRDAEG